MPSTTNWTRLAEEFKANSRSDAGILAWEGDRSVAEEGVLIAFALALQEQERLFFSNAFHRGEGNDPPDCEATGLADERIGIELTELIDPETAAAARAGNNYQAKRWSETDIAAGLAERIAAKDAGNPKGGPYDRYVLLVYTDEPGLSVDAARSVVSSRVYTATELLSEAYLLMSSDPSAKQHHCFQLNLRGV